jgi:hypothetical protein
MELQLLRAKEAIFNLISRFHIPTKMFEDSDQLYIFNYCEGALEKAFNVLGIEDNYIELEAFCKMWEENNRAIWAINLPDAIFNGFTWDIYYKCFEEKFQSWQKSFELYEE